MPELVDIFSSKKGWFVVSICELVKTGSGESLEIRTSSEEFDTIDEAYERYNELSANKDIYGVDLFIKSLEHRKGA